jgi:uncharacterized membrane protein YgcG
MGKHSSWLVAGALVLASVVLFPTRVFAAETIRDFSVATTISTDRTVDVTESLTYDFGDAQRHGILRDIPVVYVRDNGTYALHLAIESVTKDGQDEPYTTSISGNIMEIKVGSADTLITGPHRYQIQYRTNRAINFFTDHSELYWNVTGNLWQIPIEKSSFDLTLPPQFTLNAVTSKCFTGSYGSTASDCQIKQNATGFHVESTRSLDPDEGLTVVFGFPPGAIVEPSVVEHVTQFLMDNLSIAFPLLALVVMGGLWWRKGRDPRRQTVVPEYEAPRGLSPGVISGAASESGASTPAVTATIIDLARRGYLKIRFGEKARIFGTEQTFTFVKQKESDDVLKPYEKDILDGLFSSGNEVVLSDLQKQKFYTSVTAFQTHVSDEVTAMKVFTANPSLVRGGYITVAFVLTWVLTAFATSSAFDTACMVATGLIIAVFGWFMPKRTGDGVQLLAEIEGFKWFLSVTEKDRLAFTDAPERTPDQFQALLPFAIVFGVEKKWAAQFASLTIPQPSWAEGNWTNMNSVMLATNLSQLSMASSSAYSAPSSAGSGGSGFSGGGSGGGFGGGGGGSW